MSQQRVTIDNTDLRARLRPYSPVKRPAQYTSRSVGGYSSSFKIPSTPSAKVVQTRPKPTQAIHRQTTVAPKPQVEVSSGLISDFKKSPITTKALPLVAKNVVKIAQSQPAKMVVSQLAQPQKQPAPTKILPARQQHSTVLMRQGVIAKQPQQVIQETFAQPKSKRTWRTALLHPTKSSILMAMATVLFIIGISVSLTGFKNNTVAHAQEAKINHQLASTSPDTAPPAGAPSTAKVSASTFASYTVAADLARYIKIPKIGVNARVLQVGVTKTGALDTPTNVFDTAWYKSSAKPGQPGATLIDGHVSSWTTNGVFYNIKKLVAGDTITIQTGDNRMLNYSVVKTIAYPVNSVDMQSLVQPVQTDKSGLNLITCGGKYDSKSGEFTQRIAVYAVLQ